MKKTIIFGFVFLLCVSFASANIGFTYDDTTPEGSSPFNEEGLLNGYVFTANSTANITVVQPLMVRTGNPGTCYLIIYNMTGTTPNAVMENTSFNGDLIPLTDTDYNITLDNQVTIYNGFDYAPTISCPSATTPNRLNWWHDDNNNPTPPSNGGQGRIQYYSGWNHNAALEGVMTVYIVNVTGGGGSPAVDVDIIETTEETVEQEQNGNITISSTSFQPIMTGNFEINQTTNASLAYTLNALSDGAGTIECQVDIGGNLYNTTSQRTMTTNSYGSMYLKSTTFNLSIGNYTTTLECRRTTTPPFNTEFSNAVGIIHKLSNSTGTPINFQSLNLTSSISSNSYQELGSFDFEVSNGTVNNNYSKFIVLDGSIIYNYVSTSNITIYAEVNGTKLGEYPRYGSAGSIGSGGGLLIHAPVQSNETTNYTIKIYGKSSSSDGSININFITKEVLLSNQEINTTLINDTTFNQTIFTDLKSINIINENHAGANLVVKAGIPFQSINGSATTQFRLKVTGINGSQIYRDVSTSYEPGIAIIQDVFEIAQTSYTITLQGMTNQPIEVLGGDLSAYVTSLIELKDNRTGIRVYDAYNNSQILSFTVTNSQGTTQSTTDGVVEFVVSNSTDTLNISTTNYFSNISLQSLESNINITLTPYSRITSISQLTGNPIWNFTVQYNGTDYSTTDGTAHVPIYNGTHEVTVYDANHSGNEYAQETLEITASPYNENQTFYLWLKNSIFIQIRDEETGELITDANATIKITSDTYFHQNKTDTGDYNVTLLAPGDYIIAYNATNNYTGIDYGNKFYYITLEDRTYINITLYLTKENTQDTAIYVYDQFANPVENVIVKSLRHVNSTNTYTLVTMGNTDPQGLTVLPFKRGTELYKLVLEYNGLTVLTTTPGPIETDTIELFVTLGDDIVQDLTPLLEVSSDLYHNWFNGSIDWNVTYFFNDPNNYVTQGCLYIYENNITVKTLMDSSCTSASSGTITINNAYTDGKFVFVGTITFDGDEYLMEYINLNIGETPNKFKTSLVLFLSLLVIVALGLGSMIISPILGFSTISVSLIIIGLIGIAPSIIVFPIAIVGIILAIGMAVIK